VTLVGACFECAVFQFNLICFFSFFAFAVPPGQPKIEGYRTGELIQVADQLTLACICRAGNPKAQLRWTRNDQSISFSSSLDSKSLSFNNVTTSGHSAHVYYDNHKHQLVTNNEQDRDRSEEEFAPETEVTNTLTIRVRPEDNGAVYTCVANNEVIAPGVTLPTAHSFSVKLNVQCK
jgi:hypothetical protein